MKDRWLVSCLVYVFCIFYPSSLQMETCKLLGLHLQMQPHLIWGSSLSSGKGEEASETYPICIHYSIEAVPGIELEICASPKILQVNHNLILTFNLEFFQVFVHVQIYYIFSLPNRYHVFYCNRHFAFYFSCMSAQNSSFNIVVLLLSTQKSKINITFSVNLV